MTLYFQIVLLVLNQREFLVYFPKNIMNMRLKFKKKSFNKFSQFFLFFPYFFQQLHYRVLFAIILLQMKQKWVLQWLKMTRSYFTFLHFRSTSPWLLTQRIDTILKEFSLPATLLGSALRIDSSDKRKQLLILFLKHSPTLHDI